MAVCFPWPLLEVGVGYRAGASCLGVSGAIGFLCGMDSIVLSFVNIALTASLLIIVSHRNLLAHT